MACLETDYQKLVGMYSCNHNEMIKCPSNENLMLPTILLCEHKKTEAMLKDYKGSVVYNNINVRLDDLSIEGR